MRARHTKGRTRSGDTSNPGSQSRRANHSLGPIRDTRFDVLPDFVVLDRLCIKFVMGLGMRAWAYQRHLADQHVEQLRQFVDAGFRRNLPILLCACPLGGLGGYRARPLEHA